VIIGAAELAFTDLLDNPIHSLQRASGAIAGILH
jgi:hypothetical protein